MKYSYFAVNAEDVGDVTLDGDVIEKVTKFFCLEDVLSFGRRVQESVTARIRSAWKKFKDIAIVHCTRIVSLKLQEVCIKVV